MFTKTWSIEFMYFHRLKYAEERVVRYCENKSLNFGTNLVLMQNSAWGLFFTTLIGHVYYFTDEKWYWMKGAFKRLLQTIKELYIYAIMVWWSLLKGKSPMNGCCYWVETPSSSSWRGHIAFQVAFLVATYHQTLLVFEALSQRLSNFKKFSRWRRSRKKGWKGVSKAVHWQ